MDIDLVIFDCDGVLIDSEVLATQVDVACLAEDGIALTEQEILDRYVGISLAGMLADLEQRFGRALGDDFAGRHARRLTALFEAELQAIPGVAAVLDGLGGKVCVASSSAPARLRHALETVGLYRRFEPHVFSASEVARGKPAPDLFLYAAARLGAEPRRCVVVEDSVAGIAAAVAARMVPIGFTGGSHCRPGHAARLTGAGAAVVIETMAALPPALAALAP